MKIFRGASEDEDKVKINLNLTHGRLELASVQQAQWGEANSTTRVVTLICIYS
jgi:hypothetical protein